MKSQSNQDMISQSSNSIIIPLLNLGNDLKRPKYLTQNISLNNLHGYEFRKSPDFLKQKSFYRYYISKNNCSSKQSCSTKIATRVRTQVDQSYNELKHKKNRSKEHNHTSKMLTSSSTFQGPVKERYFKRRKQGDDDNKNRNKIKREQLENVQSSCEVNQKEISEDLNTTPEQEQKNGISEQLKQQGAQIICLKKKLENIENEKEELDKRLDMYERKVQQYRQQNDELKQKNKELQLLIQRNTESLSLELVEETKLSNQLKAKERKIAQLESSLRYSELENSMLKKVKTQCVQQKELIQKLERAKKVLTSKLKKMNEQKKKNQIFSIKSQHSELSLNLSQQDEEFKSIARNNEHSQIRVRVSLLEKQGLNRPKMFSVRR